MFNILLTFLFSIPVGIPRAEVEVVTSEFDAVWVPAGTTGPIVAVPLDEVVFEVRGE
jgi:hypothetical protein